MKGWGWKGGFGITQQRTLTERVSSLQSDVYSVAVGLRTHTVDFLQRLHLSLPHCLSVLWQSICALSLTTPFSCEQHVMIAYLTMLLIRIQVFYNNSLVGVGTPFYLHSLIHIIRFVLCLLSCDLLCLSETSCPPKISRSAHPSRFLLAGAAGPSFAERRTVVRVATARSVIFSIGLPNSPQD